MICIGIEIGGTKLQLVTGDGNGSIQSRHRFLVDATAGAEGIRRQIAETLPRLAQTSGAAAVGVGFGGPVAWRTGRICRSHQVEGWSEFDLAGWLGGLCDLPIRVITMRTWQPWVKQERSGPGRNPCSMSHWARVGGGLVVDGRITNGAAPGEAEIGHVRPGSSGDDRGGALFGWAVDRRIRALTGTAGRNPRAAHCGNDPREAAKLGEAILAGDQAACKLLAEIAEDLAFGLSHVTTCSTLKSSCWRGFVGSWRAVEAGSSTACRDSSWMRFCRGRISSSRCCGRCRARGSARPRDAEAGAAH